MESNHDEWCKFLHDNKFLVGISIDGPKHLHDHYRIDFAGKGTFDRVYKALQNCKKHNVEFNTLTLLNKNNIEHPDEIFDLLVTTGVDYLQFIPCVELDPATGQITDFSITPQQFGNFLCKLFDRWCDFGPQNISIRDFESFLSYYLNGRHTICTFDKRCNAYVVVEHTGDVFCCDFFVQPKWKLGNIFDTPIEKLASSKKKRQFGRIKQNLCDKCFLCQHLDICRGGCMKDRAPFDSNEFGKESYFCQAYRQFFDYATPRFKQIAAEMKANTLT